jgi:nucleoside-triphosphatase THEP1
MRTIYILTGPTGSGKTTNLKFWCERHAESSGILSPLIQGKRHFYDLHSKETFAMELPEETGKPLRVGKYLFDPASFAWASRKLKDAVKQQRPWLVIDEIGPLELSGEGLAPALEYVLSWSMKTNAHLILVVREQCVEAVLSRFEIDTEPLKIITLSDLKYLDPGI